MKNQRGIVWAPILIMSGVVILFLVVGYFSLPWKTFHKCPLIGLRCQAGTEQYDNHQCLIRCTPVAQNNTNTSANVNNATNQAVNNNVSVNSNSTVNTNTSVSELKTYEGPFLVAIKYPKKYTLEKNTEANRRGSYEAWNIIPQGNAPYLQQLQIFRRDTIESFNNKCSNSNTPCFFGDYPTVERFDGFMKAFNTPNPQSYLDYQVMTLGTETYLVKDIDAVGEGGKIREYNTTIGGVTLITLWAYIPDSTYDAQADAQVRPWQINYMGF